MDFGKIATKGQKHIPTAAWNAMREVAQEFENGLPGVEQTEIKRNPFLVTIENATGASIEPFAVLEISDAMFPNRTGTDFLNEAINRGVELKGIKPSGDPEKNIAITLDGGPNGTLVQAVVVGAVPCKVMVETSSAENYKYAIPVANQTGYLKAAESGNIRILWKETGTGIKNCYLLPDSTGNAADNKIIVLCEEETGSLKFSKCGLNGDRLTYDEDEQITAVVPPYIEAVQQGGYYLIDWFSKYNSWVVVAGTCAEDNREYQPFTTVPISYHVKDGAPSSSSPQSGTAASIGEHDEYATLETNLIWTQDIVGYPGRSSNLFYQAPTFALNTNRDAITYSGLKLNPGAAGIAVYQFVVTNCNGACRDVYTVAFKCTETNVAPEVTMNTTSFTLHLDGEFNGDIGTIVDNNNDTCVIYDKQISGDANILTTHTLTIDNSNKIHLYLKASDAHVGNCQITFYVDDSHNLKATTGTYEQITLNISVTNAAPIVTITQRTIEQEAGTTETYIIGTVSDPDGDSAVVSDFRTAGNSISSANVTIDGSNLKAIITLASGAESGADIYFKVNDQYGVYSSGSPAEQHIVVNPIPPENEPGT